MSRRPRTLIPVAVALGIVGLARLAFFTHRPAVPSVPGAPLRLEDADLVAAVRGGMMVKGEVLPTAGWSFRMERGGSTWFERDGEEIHGSREPDELDRLLELARASGFGELPGTLGSHVADGSETVLGLRLPDGSRHRVTLLHVDPGQETPEVRRFLGVWRAVAGLLPIEVERRGPPASR